MNLKDIRRKNLRTLARALGGVSQLAMRVGKSQSQISHLIAEYPVKNIGDRIASQIENAFGKPAGWLDIEHHEIADLGNIYDTNSVVQHAYYQVPVISWEDADAWLIEPKKFNLKSFPNYLIISLPLNPLSFAVKVKNDMMESHIGGVSFPRGSMIIVDPMFEPGNNNYVLARMRPGDDIVFKQYVVDGGLRYLKPLNPRYPILAVEAECEILGVVRLMLLEFR